MKTSIYIILATFIINIFRVVEFSSTSKYVSKTGPTFLRNLQCTGSELDIGACNNVVWNSICDHAHDVGINCSQICLFTKIKQTNKHTHKKKHKKNKPNKQPNKQTNKNNP